MEPVRPIPCLCPKTKGDPHPWCRLHRTCVFFTDTECRDYCALMSEDEKLEVINRWNMAERKAKSRARVRPDAAAINESVGTLSPVSTASVTAVTSAPGSGLCPAVT